MKLFYSIIFCLMTSLMLAQSTRNFAKDTLLANHYYEQAIELMAIEDSQSTVIQLLIDANRLYQPHPFSEKQLFIKSLLAYQLGKEKQNEKAQNLALEAINLAKKARLDTLHPSLKYAYWLLTQTAQQNHQLDYGKAALQCTPKHSRDYFEIAEYVLIQAAYNEKLKLVQSLVGELELLLGQSKNEELNIKSMIVYRGKMLAAYLLKNYEKSNLYAYRVLELNKSYPRYTTEKLAPFYIEIGKNHTGLSEYGEALKWMYKGLETTSAKEGTPERGTFYYNLANVYEQKGEYQFAIELYKRAVRAFLKNKAHYKVNLIVVYNNLASVYLATKQYEQAAATLKKIEQIAPLSYPQYLTLANIFGLQYEYQTALENIQKALIKVSTTFDKLDIRQNPTLYEEYKNKLFAAAILATKGYLLYELGNEEEEIDLMQLGINTIDLSIKIEEQHKAQMQGFEASKFTVNQTIITNLTYMLDGQYMIYKLAPSDSTFNRFLELTERRKAIQLVETLSLPNLPKAFYDQEKALNKLIQVYYQKLDLATYQQENDSIQHYQNALFRVNQEMEGLIKNIRQQYPKEAALMYNNQYATLHELQTTLKDKTVLIAYSYGQKRGYITVVSSTSKQIVEMDISTLATDIQQLNQLIQDPFAFQKEIRAAFIDKSHRLYQTLLQPIEAMLKDKERLMVMVEGLLFKVPFELLLASNEKKTYNQLDFLIKKFEVNYHYSVTTHLQLKKKVTPRDNSLLAFAPIFEKGAKVSAPTRSHNFSLDSLFQSVEEDKFIALPHTRKEVQTIRQLLHTKGNTKVLLQRQATKSNLVKQLQEQSYQFVHIATHGLVNFQNYELSALACYNKNQRMENLLYAKEIQFENIHADLVVLSSCESGIGRLVKGEGLIALNRSFIYAGAKNVLFSLWKINDKYSSELMIHFYTYYLKGESYTTALRHAKLKMLETAATAEPTFWAAFVLIGE